MVWLRHFYRWGRLHPLRIIYVTAALNAVLLVLLVWTAASYDVMGIGTAIEKGTKDVYSSAKPAKEINRVRFTQMWSTGHVGTRFLTKLLVAPEVFDKNFSTNYMAWNELELPHMRQIYDQDGSKNIWVPFSDMSLYEFKVTMSDDKYKKIGLGWYGGKIIKGWNNRGNTAVLREYLEKKRMPALRSVYERYNNQEDNPDEKLNHFIKVGHSSIFFDLSDYYEVLSSMSLDMETTIDVDFVRIRRNRIEVANSFIGSKDRRGPVGYGRTEAGVITNPTMGTALLRFESLGGPLPDAVYWNWTVFQRHLWFCDEIEARWRVFLEEHPEVRHYELAYVPSNEDPHHQVLTPSSIDDLAMNFLEIGLPLSPYIHKIPKMSHVSEKRKESRMTREEQEEQAIGYSKNAPWCLQFEGDKNSSTNKPNATTWNMLDCGLST